MENRKITINIAGRVYPLNVKPSEEENLRKVGKQIDALIKDFENNFDIRDKQDALAMCCLKLGTDAEAAGGINENQKEVTRKRLEEIFRLMDGFEK